MDVLCCVAALLGTSQAKDKARSICNTTLKIPWNYQAGRGDVQEGNGNIHNRSLSAWTWRVNYEENRIPKSISEAVCNFSYCTDPKSDPDKAELHDKLNSVPIHQEVLVLNLNKTLNCYQASYISVTVGCTCVRAKTS
ncbi:interleukin 17a/f2 [Megalops cyprinoides]|uniref:interleukin 17a/f2 n=1 Tax=Megalops cyprinoides TaxID=118141 RepID=UPI00186494C5|nr:interleukin 17a/f2 [Megalops cyprinoides]